MDANWRHGSGLFLDALLPWRTWYVLQWFRTLLWSNHHQTRVSRHQLLLWWGHLTVFRWNAGLEQVTVAQKKPFIRLCNTNHRFHTEERVRPVTSNITQFLRWADQAYAALALILHQPCYTFCTFYFRFFFFFSFFPYLTTSMRIFVHDSSTSTIDRVGSNWIYCSGGFDIEESL